MREPIPQPRPVEYPPPPPRPEQAPSTTRVVFAQASGAAELVILTKRTYAWEPGQRARVAEQQLPLDEAGIPHEPLAEGRPASWRSLPDVVGYKAGTDVVVQGSARPGRPTASLAVALDLAGRRIEILVFGPRRCCSVAGKPAFTPPEPFTEVPLRYELAYGGRDPAFEAVMMEEVARITPAETLRRAAPSAEGLFGTLHPLMYPRNRFGQGYVLDARPEAFEGRELPQLERREDLLTPERLPVADFLKWERQPIPAGFDYLDPMTFPRMGMFACPPMGYQPGARCREAEAGLVPADFCRGNISSAQPSQLPTLLHPWAGHCASLGLNFPYLKGDETLALHGMDPARPSFTLVLPGERPSMTVEGLEARPVQLESVPFLLRVEVDARRLCMVWAARYRLRVPLPPSRLPEIAAATRITWRVR